MRSLDNLQSEKQIPLNKFSGKQLILREGGRRKKKNQKNNKPHNCTKDDFHRRPSNTENQPNALPIIIETSVFTSH